MAILLYQLVFVYLLDLANQEKSSKKDQPLFNQSYLLIYLIVFFNVPFAYPVCFYDHDADKTAKRYIWSAMFSVFIQLYIGIFRIWSQKKWY